MKENDIRPKDLMELKKPALEHDIQFLKTRFHQFVPSNCIACTSSNVKPWAVKNGFKYSICNDCATIYTNPRPTPELLESFYKQSENYAFWNKFIFPTTDQVRKEKIFKPRAERTIEICKKYNLSGGVLIEIGAAFGTYCEAISEHKFFERVIAVEPTPGLAETCRTKGIETHEEVIEKLSFEKNSADVVANFEVLEHLANPKDFVKKAISFLKVGGLFICTCPNGQSLGAKILHEQFSIFDHEHVNYFNPQSIAILLESENMEVLEVTTPGKLDIDILKKYTIEQEDLFKNDIQLKQLLISGNEKTLELLQEIVINENLSSHMWVIARKR